MKSNLLLVIVFLAGCATTVSDNSETRHIGLWDLVADYCDETYELRADGTQTVISLPEISTDTYTFKRHGDTDFYAWEYTVIEYNNKPSCNGTFDTHLGDNTLAFVKFKNNYTEMHIYSWPNDNAYIGGYLRKRGV